MEAHSRISLSFMGVFQCNRENTNMTNCFQLEAGVNVLDLHRLKFHYYVELFLTAFTNEETLSSNHCLPKCLLQRAKEIKFTIICTSREAKFASARNVAFSRKQGTIFGNNVSVCNNCLL